MVLKKIVGRIVGSHVAAPSPQAWDEERARHVAETLKKRELDEQARDPFRGIPLLSMACFVEDLDPRALLLAPETLEQVCRGLERLERMRPLQAYVQCLDTLSCEETPTARVTEEVREDGND